MTSYPEQELVSAIMRLLETFLPPEIIIILQALMPIIIIGLVILNQIQSRKLTGKTLEVEEIKKLLTGHTKDITDVVVGFKDSVSKVEGGLGKLTNNVKSIVRVVGTMIKSNTYDKESLTEIAEIAKDTVDFIPAVAEAAEIGLEKANEMEENQKSYYERLTEGDAEEGSE